MTFKKVRKGSVDAGGGGGLPPNYPLDQPQLNLIGKCLVTGNLL